MRRFAAAGEPDLQPDSPLDPDLVELVMSDLGATVRRVDFADREPAERPTAEEAEAAGLPMRPPVVTVMGHVDHGKTTLLDVLRGTRRTAGEAGGITQALGSFTAQLGDAVLALDARAAAEAEAGKKAKKAKKTRRNKKRGDIGAAAGAGGGPVSSAASHAGKGGVSASDGVITFLDTPGHRLFAGMRERGASLTDVVVLIIAAEDGIQEQTEECVRVILEEELPCVVAITKIDRFEDDEYHLEKAREQVCKDLDSLGLTTEESGGDVPVVMLSSTTGEGIEDLKETLQLQAELLELRAATDAPGELVVLESSVQKGMGAVADCIVEWGTVKVGDPIVTGEVAGRVKAIVLDDGSRVKTASPGFPVRITGLTEPPTSGTSIMVVENDRRAKEVAAWRARRRAAAKRARDAAKAAARHLLSSILAQYEVNDRQRRKDLRRRADQRKQLAAQRLPIPPELEVEQWEIDLEEVLRRELEDEASGVRARVARQRSGHRGQQVEAKSDGEVAERVLGLLGDGLLEREAQQLSYDLDEVVATAERLRAEAFEAPVLLKADTQGALDALRAAIVSLPDDKVTVSIIGQGLGPVTKADVSLASDTSAKVFAFGTQAPGAVEADAERAGVKLHAADVIYDLMRDIVESLSEHLPPLMERKVVGRLRVKQLFGIRPGKNNALSVAAGCEVKSGHVMLPKGQAPTQVLVLRDGEEVGRGTISSLRLFKDEVEEVEEGSDCGVGIDGVELQEGDDVLVELEEEVPQLLTTAFHQ